MSQDGLRQALQAVQKKLQLSILLGSSPIHGHRFHSEFHIDRSSLGLIRPLKIWSVPFGWIVAAGAIGFAALDHPSEYRPFAKAFQMLELPL
jgi:hypothetical protein